MSYTSYWRSELPGKTHNQKVEIIENAIIKILAESNSETMKKSKVNSILGFAHGSLGNETCFARICLQNLVDKKMIMVDRADVGLTLLGKEHHEELLSDLPTDFYPVNTNGPMGKVLPQLKRRFKIKYPHLVGIFDCSDVSIESTKVTVEMLDPPKDILKMNQTEIALALEKGIRSVYGKGVKLVLKTAHAEPMEEVKLTPIPASVEVSPMEHIVDALSHILGKKGLEEAEEFTLETKDYSFKFWKRFHPNAPTL